MILIIWYILSKIVAKDTRYLPCEDKLSKLYIFHISRNLQVNIYIKTNTCEMIFMFANMHKNDYCFPYMVL